MKTHISFRLRKELDADLIGMEIKEEELPELCRNGLRLMLGIRSKKTVQVVEQPIQATLPVQPAQPQERIPVKSKSAAFKAPLINKMR